MCEGILFLFKFLFCFVKWNVFTLCDLSCGSFCIDTNVWIIIVLWKFSTKETSIFAPNTAHRVMGSRADVLHSVAYLFIAGFVHVPFKLTWSSIMFSTSIQTYFHVENFFDIPNGFKEADIKSVREREKEREWEKKEMKSFNDVWKICESRWEKNKDKKK